ncbi:MAG: hypothetical protein LBM01_00745 [Christensenellaceae bacterium]|jgi:hypothetical protein|nr:hypothetical protein [Christensenellaceae bacterium]
MVKIPYISKYSLFERIDLIDAEKLLAETNDFINYNRGVYATADENDGSAQNDLDFDDVAPTSPAPIESPAASKNKISQADFFEKLVATKDIYESSLVGMQIEWEALQKILLDEQNAKIPVYNGALAQVFPRIAATASVLLHAQFITQALKRMIKDPTGLDAKKREKIEAENAKIAEIDAEIRRGFEEMLETLEQRELNLPAYSANKKELLKIKTLEGYLDFCMKYFAIK